MKIVLTGANGFLGWHTRLRLHARTTHTIVPVTRADWPGLPKLMQGADAVIHLAGVNRAQTDVHVLAENIRLAGDLAHAIPSSCSHIVYANSSQAGNGTPYGTGKAEAANVLAAAADRSRAQFTDVRLPNIFGEHGRPRYNSFVATFVDAIVQGGRPSIEDRQVPLLHAQDAAQALIGALSHAGGRVDVTAETRGVEEVWKILQEFHTAYAVSGEFPDLSSDFRVDLFNTYRSALFPRRDRVPLNARSDVRGTFLETVRSKRGEGQASISTTHPGRTRGEHYHLHKIERFAVVQGKATIALRRMFNQDVLRIAVTGNKPTAVDMPTGWAHSITNTGRETLITQFWSHELYRPECPDTYPAPVEVQGHSEGRP